MGKKSSRPRRRTAFSRWNLFKRLRPNFLRYGKSLKFRRTDGLRPRIPGIRMRSERYSSPSTKEANWLRLNIPDTTAFGRSNFLPTKNETKRENSGLNGARGFFSRR